MLNLLVRLLCASALVAACSKPKSEPKPKPKPIDKVAALVEAMCACPDEACRVAKMDEAKQMDAEMMKQIQKDEPEALAELGARLVQCAQEPGATVDPEAYAKKSKSSEAIQFLKKLSDAARMHYETPNYGSMSGSLATVSEKSFPEAVGPTPPLGTCCKDGGKCSPDPSYWEHPTWQALNFSIADPHYYSYEFTQTAATDTEAASFTVLARGDLDCDGEYSTFSLYGEVVDGELQSAGDVIMVDRLE